VSFLIEFRESGVMESGVSTTSFQLPRDGLTYIQEISARCRNLIDRDIWRDLDRCWKEFESEKRAPMEHDNIARRLERDLFTSGWQIFIFECHNVIREGLKHFVSSFFFPNNVRRVWFLAPPFGLI